MASPTSPLTFAGSSSYASSFQQVISRAVAIAGMPLALMRNRVSDLQSQQATLSSLEATFSGLQNSLQSMSSSAGGSMAAAVSDPAALTASASSSALAGTYSIEIEDLGSSSTTISKSTLPAVSDPTTGNISSSNSFTLTINGTPLDPITPTGNSLVDLADAINHSGAAVQATIVNLGSTATPEYHLAITSTNLGGDTIQLNDGTLDLLDTVSTGTPAEYKVNGIATTISSNSHQVTLAPGLTVDMLKADPGHAVTITVANSLNYLSGAVSGFVTSYNSAVDALGQQHGSNAGFLAGQSIVLSLQDAMRRITQYTSSPDGVGNLSDLGVNLDSTGRLSFDGTKFNAANAADIQAFLGTTTTDGFLKWSHDALDSLADPADGALADSITTVQAQIARQNSQILDEQTRVEALQTSLQAQLAAADAAIAVLEQQRTFFKDMFAAQYLNNNYGSR